MIGSEYLAALKMADLDAGETKIQEAPMIYKGINRLYGDPIPLRKKMEDYGSAVCTYLSLKKAASLYRRPTVVR